MTAHQHWYSSDERIAWNNFSRFLMASKPFTPQAVNKVLSLAKRSGTEDYDAGEEGNYSDYLVDSRHKLMMIINDLPEETREELRKAVDSVAGECREAYIEAVHGKVSAPAFSA